MTARARLAARFGIVALLANCTGSPAPAREPAGQDYRAIAAQAVSVLEHRYYAGAGLWNLCVPAICAVRNSDWGSDSLTYSLYLHWQLTADRQVAPIMAALTRTARRYAAASPRSSDVPMWDAIADIREYQVTGDATALANAEAAFAAVDSSVPSRFAAGACPAINYQVVHGGSNDLKTLETDSNYIKAALLLYQVTKSATYLTKAERKYAAVRRHFLDPRVPLYSVYVFDNGRRCVELPRRFFASVNGNMIWAGAELSAMSRNARYLADALATARAVARYLSDATGVYADLQAENDIAEPMIEAMYLLASTYQQSFARDWLLTAASAAAADVTSRGTYGRFFDGPPPRAPVTAWQVNGGISLMIAAAALDPAGVPADPGYWLRAVFVSDGKRLPAQGGAVTIRFTGSAIAIIGTLGQRCCQAGHASVRIDGVPVFDHTGIWQNKSSSARTIPHSVLFAWRWPGPGRHTVTIGPAGFNAKEGGTYFDMTGYFLVR